MAGIPVNAAGVAITTSTGAPIGADESFGMVTGVSPDTDGLIHYGMVRVENNLLKTQLTRLLQGRPDGAHLARDPHAA